MKLLLQIMKANRKLFFQSNENINSFFLMAKFAIGSHPEFFHSDIVDNIFLTDISNNRNYKKEINKYVNLYVKSKKIYNILTRFFYNIKIKKTKRYEMNTDLYFNDLSLFPSSQKIELLENNTLYTFRLTDIINIWSDSLLDVQGLFPTPKKIKNPYTNIDFHDNNLYNIYLKILHSNFHIPIVISKYFYSEFNINKLLDNYYPYLKDKCIQKFCKEGNYYEKYEYIENMFFDYRKDINWVHVPTIQTISGNNMITYCKKLNVSLKYYLFGKYSTNSWTKDKYYNLGISAVKTFIRLNEPLIIKPRIPPSSTLRNRIRRRERVVNNNNIILPPPPPPSTPPPPPFTSNRQNLLNLPPPPPITIPTTISTTANTYTTTNTSTTENTSTIANTSTTENNRIREIDTINHLNNNQIVNTYQTNRDAINTLIEDIDLSLLNSNAVSPFLPSYQLPRTPNRI